MENWPHLISTLQWRGISLDLRTYMSLLENKNLIKNENEIFNCLNLTANKKEKLRNWKAIGQSEIDWCKKNNTKIITPLSNDYPKAYSKLSHPPMLLTYLGSPAWVSEPCVSVVGSRNPSSDTEAWMSSHFIELLKDISFTTVSGGARGVDQLVHSLSLRANKPTILIVPAGLGCLYPASLNKWVNGIIKGGGALVSQFSPFQKMNKALFHQRNRLIAALAQLTFVVEARRRSGTLITAKAALDYGKEICVLPCSPNISNGLGGLDLLFDGAHVLRDKEDLKLLIERYVI